MTLVANKGRKKINGNWFLLRTNTLVHFITRSKLVFYLFMTLLLLIRVSLLLACSPLDCLLALFCNMMQEGKKKKKSCSGGNRHVFSPGPQLGSLTSVEKKGGAVDFGKS